jgi:hypothetical protein
MKLKVSDSACVNSDAYHERKQLPEGFRFMNAEYEGKPIFRVVSNHAMANLAEEG